MLEEHVEIVRLTHEAADRRDREEWLSLHDEDHVVITGPGWPEAEEIRGRDAAWEFYLGMLEAFDVRAADVQLQAVGADKVLVHHRHSTRGRASGTLDDFLSLSERNSSEPG